MLKTRILSAIVLAPPALAAVWFGGFSFTALVAVVAILMGWEWDRVSNKAFGPAGIITSGAGFGASLIALSHPDIGLLIVAAGAVATGVLGFVQEGRRKAGWQMLGTIYVGLPCVGLVWLRGDGDLGRAVIIWLFLIVWATDIGAYAFGRTVGGPLLAPRISPNKTWAGLLGGMGCAGLLGVLLVTQFEPARTFQVLGLSVILAVVAQLGDLAESRFKRLFGVKDTSQIIPGHGGVLDRLDGLLAAGAVLAALVWLQGGVGVS